MLNLTLLLAVLLHPLVASTLMAVLLHLMVVSTPLFRQIMPTTSLQKQLPTNLKPKAKQLKTILSCIFLQLASERFSQPKRCTHAQQ